MLSKPTTTKLPLHKKIENTLNKKQQEKHGRKSNSQKAISNTNKSTVSHNNPTKKVKTNVPASRTMKKETNLTIDMNALTSY